MFVYLGLGSNQGDRIAHLRQALEWLTTIIDIASESSVYESAPMYVTDQPYFLNMAVMGETFLTPHTLLQALKVIEAEMGRDLSPDAQRYGPRPIDIDILLATNVANPTSADDYIVLDTPDLTIPHPRLAERAFVLFPLFNISYTKNLIHPLFNKFIKDFREDVVHQDLTLLGTIDVASMIVASRRDDLRHIEISSSNFLQDISIPSLEQEVFKAIIIADDNGSDGAMHLAMMYSRYNKSWFIQIVDRIIRELEQPTMYLPLKKTTREQLLAGYQDEIKKYVQTQKKQ